MVVRFPALLLALVMGLVFAPLSSAQDAPPADDVPASETPVDASEQPSEETEPAPPQPIRPEDYGEWERVGRPTLSDDGRWAAYSSNTVEGAYELRLRMLATDSTKSFDFARGARFSGDGKWLAFSIGIHPDQARNAKRPTRSKLGLHNLITGKTTEVENVSSFTFSDNGAFLLMRRYPISGKKSRGSDLVVRNLETGVDTAFGNVSEYRFNDDGTLLAMVIDAEDQAGNGVQLFDVATGQLRTLVSSNHNYRRMTWREDATDLAVLREHEHGPKEDASFSVLAWPGVDGDQPKLRTFDPTQREEFPDDRRVVDFQGVSWSDDGGYLYFGLREWDRKPKSLEKKQSEEKPKPAKRRFDDSTAHFDEFDREALAGLDLFRLDAPPKGGGKKGKKSDSKPKKKSLRDTLKDPAGVEVWHANDVDIHPKQKVRAGREKRRSQLATWNWSDDLFCAIEDDLTETAWLTENPELAIGLDNTPYDEIRRFGPTLYDVYRVRVPSGEREKMLEGVKYVLGTDPTTSTLLFVREGHIHRLNLDSFETDNLTEGLSVPFVNQEMSQLTDEKPPYGIMGWSEDGTKLYLYDRWDAWQFSLADDTAPHRLTRGREEQVRHRRLALEEADEFISAGRPIYFSLYGEWTKKSGYAAMDLGDRPERLLWDDRNIGALTKAKDAPVYAYMSGTTEDSPDIYVTDTRLSDATAVSESNPQQSQYLWGRSELVDYESANGERLQGTLRYPADYDPTQQYPMIVYIYEKLSQGHHRYSTPTETNPYNPSVWSAEGYFVLQPDIVYRPQNPGLSAVECLVPAVRAVLATGKVDPERVGLIGHSWGAYQTAFVVTQTDMFAAGIAGAPLTNMISMSMSTYWNSGETNAWIFHESQGRMDRPFWEDVDTYIANSPIFSIDSLNTPLLVAFGDNDGAVDFNQGVEMYNAARLAGKPFVMLVYPGENHGLRQRPNQVDYHYRVLDWFDHYLAGNPAESWITDGQRFLDREKELEAMREKSGGARRPGRR